MRGKIILLSLVLAAASGCSTSHFIAYKMDIRQGNFVTPEMREKLKLGMNKQQVRYVLGTPLLSDAFHNNRWDYNYTLTKRNEVVEQRAMTLYFEGDNLVRIDDGASSEVATAVVAVSAVAATSAVADAAVISTAPASANEAQAAVQASVQAWASTWSARDVKQYFAAYAVFFKPDGMSHADWLAQREQRVGKAKSIAVTLSDVQVRVQDETHATASFKQDYRSDVYQDSVRKTLALEKVGDAWLIVAENIGK